MPQMGWLARQDGYDPDAFDVPGEQTYDRRLDQTWPGRLAQDTMGAVLAPGRALQSTEPITTEEMIKPAADLAGLVMSGGIAGTGEKAGVAVGSGPIRKAPELAMDEVSRLARAAEQGFDTSRTLYHGTTNEFDAFKPNRGGITYLTDRPDIAEIYANLRKEESGKSYAKDFGREATADPSIMPVYAKAKNPLVISDQGPGGGGWLTDNLANALGVEYKGGASAYRDLLAEARRRGHDQIEVRNMSDLGGDQTQIFMLNPSDIRSKFAAFDPANEGKNMILGSGATDKKGAAAIQGIRAYHSSPHDFDKFDLAKIGTGEGAQVYGHGLYFAESPAVSGQGGEYWRQFLSRFGGMPEGDAARELMHAKFDRAKAIKSLEQDLRSKQELGIDPAYPAYAQNQRAIELLQSDKPVGPRTYEVNINADPAHMLDWDKPLSQQSERVRAAIPDIVKSEEMYRARYPHSPMADPFGSNIYSKVGATGGLRIPEAKAQASEFLREAGIPGIKYLDQGSRTTPASIEKAKRILETARTTMPDLVPGFEADLARLQAMQPSSNYVIFDPNLIRIDKKYALPLATGAGMGALAAEGNYQTE